jgi:hypothetical protein
VRGVSLALLCGVLLFFGLSSDRVSRSHLDGFKAYYDRRAVVESRLGECCSFSVPTFTEEEKRSFQLPPVRRNATPQGRCARQKDAWLLWILKTPKAASSTIHDLVEALASENHFVVNTRQLRMDWSQLDDMKERFAPLLHTPVPRRRLRRAKPLTTELVRQIRALLWLVAPQNSVLSARLVSRHWSVRVPDAGATPPGLTPRASPLTTASPSQIYIGTIREPLTRLVSHYNYLAFGPRSYWSHLRHDRKVALHHAAEASLSHR